MNPQPTLGRIVLYRRIDDGVLVPAIVADASDPERLTLFIMDPHDGVVIDHATQNASMGPSAHFQKGVLYDRETSTPGRWSWPPRV